MKQTEYTSAVAAVRSKETTLLGSAFLEQLIGAPTYADACRLLAEKGLSADDADDANTPISAYMRETWQFLSELTSDLSPLSFLVVENDFHNAKAIIKSIVRGLDPAPLLLTPSLLPPEELQATIARKAFDELPDWMKAPAQEGYELLTATMDGQLFDMAMDRAALEASRVMAAASGSELCARLAEQTVAVTNVRVAYRLAERRARDELAQRALCPCSVPDTQELIEAVRKGPAEVAECVIRFGYEDLAAAAEESAAALERAADDRLLALLDEAAWMPFGAEPLAAYYVARRTEWKNLRIILSAKRAGLPQEAIRERMRVLYG